MWASMESFPFLGRRGKALTDGQESGGGGAPGSPRTGASRNRNPAPSVKVALERKVYRPGDTVVATIEIGNEVVGGKVGMVRDVTGDAVLMEDLSVEVRGIEKLDPQWLVTPKPPTAKQRRGERVILKSPSAVIASDVLISPGSSSTYMVRTTLPGVLPPTFRGTAVRYLYYITAAIRWTRCAAENGHGPSPPATSSSERLEVRSMLPVWTLSHSNGLTHDESHYGESGIVPPYALEVEIEWKEDSSESIWAWAADSSLKNGEDRVSTPKSNGGSTFTSPTKSISFDRFDRSLSISSRATPLQLDPSTFSTPTASRRHLLPTSASGADLFSTPARWKQGGAGESGLAHKRACSLDSLSSEAVVASMNGHHTNGVDARHSTRVDDETVPDSPHSPAAVNNRGKSYNIRMDDEVLVKFSPKNPASTYVFGDMVAGTLQFFHNDRRRCLEVTAVLETREVLNPAAVHPSRKNSSTITKRTWRYRGLPSMPSSFNLGDVPFGAVKTLLSLTHSVIWQVHSEYYEIVNDVMSTQFLFSIPQDGPASMGTPLLSLEWVLRFEFVATPAGVEWSKVEHPMLIDVSQRRKGEWSLPITVVSGAPPKGVPEAEKRAKNNSWARSPSAIYRSLFEEEYPVEASDHKASASGRM